MLKSQFQQTLAANTDQVSIAKWLNLPLSQILHRIIGKMKYAMPDRAPIRASYDNGDADYRDPLTWSWTSSSHNSSCIIRSKGRKRASLKWKWGGSFQSVRTSVRMSWTKETAFWDTCLSLWQAAYKIHERETPPRLQARKNLVSEGFANSF